MPYSGALLVLNVRVVIKLLLSCFASCRREVLLHDINDDSITSHLAVDGLGDVNS